MKKILFAVIAVVGMVSAQSQQWTVAEASRGSVVNKIESWTAFSSDSLASVYTAPVDVSGYDTLFVWVKGLSTNGSAKFCGAIQYGFNSGSTASMWDSSGTGIDTTNVKLETLKYITASGTKGAVYARVKLIGNGGLGTVSATQNRKDVAVSIYLVGRKRGIAQIPN